MNLVGLPFDVYDNISSKVRPVSDFLDESSKWIGHVFKAIQLTPQHMPKGVVSKGTVDGCDRFGTVGCVFTDFPGLCSDIEALAGDVAALAGNIFSADAWYAAALSARSVGSGVVHSIVDLGLGAIVPFAEAVDAAFTLSDGASMFFEDPEGMPMVSYVCKTGIAVSLFSLGYFSVAGTLTGAAALKLSTAIAVCSLTWDVYEI